MTRRIHVTRLLPGNNPLDETQAHHVLNVLRLADGTVVEVFDDEGAAASGVLLFRERGSAIVRVDGEIIRGTLRGVITVASAVPKGDRADWMVEKLSELGVAEWVPLAAERSVVLPEGTGKRDRWTRIATEAAKQSQRAGVMRIGPLTKLLSAIYSCSSKPAGEIEAWCLATEVERPAFATTLALQASPTVPLTIFVGPEGGWAPAELAQFGNARNVSFARLTATVLRVETAAVAAAAIAAATFAARA